MEPFMAAQKLLKGEKNVAVSLLVPYISDLRDGLIEALDELLCLPQQTTRWRSKREKR